MDPDDAPAAGPHFLGPWAVLRGTVHVLCFPDPTTGAWTLVYGTSDEGVPMAVAYSDPAVGLAQRDAAAATQPEAAGRELRAAAGFEVVATLPPGAGLWIDPGTPGWTTLSARTVDDLRAYAVPVPDGVHLVWEDFPPIPGLKALTSAVKAVGKAHESIKAVWLLGMQVGDAPREGLLVVGAQDPAAAVETVATAVRETLPDPATRGAEIRVTDFPSLPERVQQLLLTRRPTFSRVGGPGYQPHARNTVDHLRTVVTLEEARGNSVVSGDTALVDGRPAVAMKYPLDADAISLELVFTEGHALVDLGDRWAVTCAHGSPAVVGGTQEPGRLAQRLRRTWWKRWNKKPREPIPV